MNDRDLKHTILRHLAEEGVRLKGDPWEAVQVRLRQTSLSRRTRGGWMDRLLIFTQSHLPVAGLAVLAVMIVAFGLYLTTPEGQVVAQGILHLFAHTEQNTLPLPTAVPTEVLHLTSTTGPVAATQGEPTPQPTKESGGYLSGLSLDDAQALAGYPLRVPATLPEGFQLKDISFDTRTHAVSQLYDYLPAVGPSISLQQSPTLVIQPIGPSAAIHQFVIHDTVVEWVDGGWFIPLGAAQQEWEPELPMRTFRWAQDGFYFTLWFMPTTASSPLSMADMNAMVEIVMGASSNFHIR